MSCNKKARNREKGAAIIEYIMTLALFALIFMVVVPSVNQLFIGTPTHPGFATNMIEHQTIGVDESNKNITVIEGCKTIVNITAEKCDALK